MTLLLSLLPGHVMWRVYSLGTRYVKHMSINYILIYVDLDKTTIDASCSLLISRFKNNHCGLETRYLGNSSISPFFLLGAKTDKLRLERADLFTNECLSSWHLKSNYQNNIEKKKNSGILILLAAYLCFSI